MNPRKSPRQFSAPMQAQLADGPHNCEAVPVEVLNALKTVLENNETRKRDELVAPLARIMADEEWRFCSCYRHGNTPAHALIYEFVSTVGANIEADNIALGEAVLG